MIIRPARTDVAGRRPPADITHEGELYINRAERQIGYLDAKGQPTDLLVIRQFQPGSTYKVNDIVAYNGRLYRAIRSVPATVTTVATNFFDDISLATTTQPVVPAVTAGNRGQVLVVDGSNNLKWGDPFTAMDQEINGGTF